MVFSGDALELVKNKCSPEEVFDLGCGDGKHFKSFLEAYPSALICGVDIARHPRLKEHPRVDFREKEMDLFLLEERPRRHSRLFWMSHVLEHHHNFGSFLKNLRNATGELDWVAITVPPLKHNIVGGHVSLWNAGLLLYRLVLAGFDCREASVKSYGYNISVVMPVRKFDIDNIPLKYDNGDINTLSKWFPTGLNIKENFDGRIIEHNW